MTELEYKDVVEKVSKTLVRAGSSFSNDKYDIYSNYISKECSENAKWVMNAIIENAKTAEESQSPLCDDTGIPHLILEIGKNRALDGMLLEAIYQGIDSGLRKLPGRPMAINGNDGERIDQSGGLNELSEAVKPAPIMIKYVSDENVLRLTVMMLGGGPEIRAKTYRVFHKHSTDVFFDEIINWAKESVEQLGCSPCTLAIGVGRSHYEATSLMLQAMSEGRYDRQSDFERKITDRVNEYQIGALGLGGSSTVLATFMKIGHQRASGVRIVCMRLCCCFEPRKATVSF